MKPWCAVDFVRMVGMVDHQTAKFKSTGNSLATIIVVV